MYEILRNIIGYYGTYDYIIMIGSLILTIVILIISMRVIKWIIK